MNRQIHLTGPLISISILVLLVIALEMFPLTLIALTAEDGIVENLTALLFLLSGLTFLWSAGKSTGRQRPDSSYAVFFLVAWGILLVVFAGEEISWGQRVFNFDTPEAIDRANKQNEFNVHNLAVFDSFGGTGTYVSIFMLSVGLVLPILDRFAPLIRRIGMPVPSLSSSILFVGAYLYGIYFKFIPPKFDPDLQFIYFHKALEIREFILALATSLFAIEIFRQKADAAQPSAWGT